jgi:hypothetical protein
VRKLFYGAERFNGTRLLELRAGDGTQAVHVTQAKTERIAALLFAFQGAVPCGTGHIDWLDAEPMALSVLHENGGAVKPHRLIIQDRRSEHGQIVKLQPRGGIGD